MLIIVGNAEARKMLENAVESHQSSTRCVGRVLLCKTLMLREGFRHDKNSKLQSSEYS